MFLREPPPNPYDLRFALGRVPVRVHPLFWLVAMLLGINQKNPILVLIWVGAVFFSILVHEFGHAAAALAHRWPSRIVLYAAGGMALYHPERQTLRSAVIIAAAGPFAGFLFAAVVILAVSLTGHMIGLSLFGWTPVFNASAPPLNNKFTIELISDLLYVNIYWGLVNLLPIYPLDGGQISRALFVNRLPGNGLRTSLFVSFYVACALAIFSILAGKGLFLPIFFGFFAYDNYRSLNNQMW